MGLIIVSVRNLDELPLIRWILRTCHKIRENFLITYKKEEPIALVPISNILTRKKKYSVQKTKMCKTDYLGTNVFLENMYQNYNNSYFQVVEDADFLIVWC